jgi:hypothetical protein
VIVGRQFVWLHFPKTGGHTVAAAIRAAVANDAGVAFDAPDDARWHDCVADRQRSDPTFEVGGRVVVSGFRRLPWWLLSRVHYEAARPPHRCASRAMLCRGDYFEHDGRVVRADSLVARMGPRPADRWVRLEHLADDFVASFEGLLGPRVRRAAKKLRKIVNPSGLDYVKSLDFYFTPQELAGLYAANPAWAAREAEIYGDILRL